MANLNDLLYRPTVQDGASGPLREIARAADAAGAAIEQTDTRIGRTNATFAATAARLDPVERAIAAVERGTRSLSAAMEAAQRQAQAEGVAQERLTAVMQAGARAKEEAALRAVRGLTQEQQALALTRAGYEQLAIQIASTATRSEVGVRASNSIAAANDNARASSGRFGQAMGQAGFQIQDFATQVSMGQNAMVAFSTQFAQFAGIFGTAGALAGAAVTIGVIAVQLLGAGDATKKLNDALRGSEEGYSRANTAAEAWLRGLSQEGETILRLTAYYASLDEQRRAYEVRSLEAGRRLLQTESLRLTDDAAGGLTGLSRGVANAEALAAARRARGQGAGDVDAGTRAAADALAAFNAARAEDPARALVVLADALTRAAAAGGPLAGQMRTVVEELDKAVPAADRLTQQLGLNGAQLDAVRGSAGQAAGSVQNLTTAIGRASDALRGLRRISTDTPFADIDQDAARIEAQLTALRRGGMEALTATQQRQEVERAGLEANRRVYEEQLKALRELGATQDAAEAAAAAAALAAQTRAEQGVQAAQALAREQDRLRQATAGAGREARSTGAAFAEMRGMESADEMAGNIIRGNFSSAARRQAEQEEQAQRRAAEAMERQAEQSAQNISRFLSDGFTDAFLNGERGFAGMLASLQRLAIATPIRILAEAIVTPLAKSAIGAIGSVGGEGGIGGLLGLTQAGTNAASLLGLSGGAGGGISGFLNTPIGASFGAEATIGSAIGGIGGGFLAGNLIGGLTAGNSAARRTNSQIGSGAGALAGAAIGSFVPVIGTALGGILGGAAGGGLGGLFGPGRAFSGGDALVAVNDNGTLAVQGFAGKNFDQSEQLLAQAQQQVASLNGALSALGLRFTAGASPEGGFAAAIGGGESANPRSLIDALTGAGVTTLRAEDSRVQGALDRIYAGGGGTIESQITAADEAARFAVQIDAMAQAAKDAADPIGAIKRAYEDQFETAQRLGFGYEVLAAAQQKAIDAATAQKRAEEDRAAAARTNAARGILDDLTIGGLGGLDPASRATAARLRLSGARAALADGATTEEIEELSRVARLTLPIIQSIEGITTGFGELARGVAADVLSAAPGADSAGLAGVINATTTVGDQIAAAVEFGAVNTVAEIRNLAETINRLAARMGALEARAAT
jgi:hypothetical protein